MKILKDLIEKAKDTREEVEWYAEKAHHFDEVPLHLNSLREVFLHFLPYFLLNYKVLRKWCNCLYQSQEKTTFYLPFITEPNTPFK